MNRWRVHRASRCYQLETDRRSVEGTRGFDVASAAGPGSAKGNRKTPETGWRQAAIGLHRIAPGSRWHAGSQRGWPELFQLQVSSADCEHPVRVANAVGPKLWTMWLCLA